MAKPVDDRGSYRVLMPFDALTRLGFSQAGTQQLKNALPLTLAADRQRLAKILGRYGGFTNPRLRAAGLSPQGADQVTRAAVVTDIRDRSKLAGLVAAIAAEPAAGTAAEIYDYPGSYANRFDGID